MTFPTGWPDFTNDQKRTLLGHGVCDEQITELRHALEHIRRDLRSPSANNAVATHLGEIEKLASELSRKLRVCIVPEAAGMIEDGYWTQRPMDDGYNVAAHLCPRLDTLTAVTSVAIDALPKGKPARSRTGSTRPIQLIDDALMNGWVKRKMIEAAKLAAPFPAEHCPSVSEGSAYREIIEICYAAAGYRRFPKRALEAHVAACNRYRKELRTVVDEALSQAG
jgi:hypothetical protein